MKVSNHFAQCSLKVTLERTKFTPFNNVVYSTLPSGERTIFSCITRSKVSYELF